MDAPESQADSGPPGGEQRANERHERGAVAQQVEPGLDPGADAGGLQGSCNLVDGDLAALGG